MKLTPGPQLLVADLCMYRNMVTLTIKENYIIDALYTIFHAPTTFSPSGKLQSQTKTLKHFGKFCSLCSPFLFPFAMLF